MPNLRHQYMQYLLLGTPGIVGVLLLPIARLALFKGWHSSAVGWGMIGLALLLVLMQCAILVLRAVRQPPLLHWQPWLETPPVLMVGIILAGATLRLHELGTAPLWLDELWTYYVSSAANFSEMQLRLPMNWTPAYPAALIIARPLIGTSEFALRWPSAMAGVLAIAAIFALGKHLYNQRTGTIAAGLLAILLPFVSYSQEARPYMFLVAGAIFCTALWLDLIHHIDTDERIPFPLTLLYFCSAMFMAASHYIGFVLLLIQAAMQAARFIPIPRKLFYTTMLYMAFGFVYGFMVISNFLKSFANGFAWLDWISMPGPLHEVAWIYLRMPFAGNIPLTVAVLAATTGSAVLMMRSRINLSSHQTFGTTFLLMWWISPFAALLLVSQFVQPLYHERYVLALLPAALLLTGAAISKLPITRVGQAVFVSVLVISLGSELVYRSQYYRNKYEQAGFRSGVHGLRKVLEEDPHLVWGCMSYIQSYVYRYDLERVNLSQPPLGCYDLAELDQVIDDLDARIAARQPGSLWLIFFNEHHNEMEALIEHSSFKLTLIEKREYDNATLWHFQVEPYGAAQDSEASQ